MALTPQRTAFGVDEQEIDAALEIRPADVATADRLTFAKNVFIPLTTACRYTCTYCTFFDPPGEASLLSRAQVKRILDSGVEAGCTEALFTFGDDPDSRYTDVHDQLDAYGHDSIHEYLREMCELALDIGLLPHSNPGDQSRAQMDLVADVNASMGVMLETTADVSAHAGPRKKTPEQRLETLRTAGELQIPFTTGILVGIGETWRDRAESLLCIQALHEQYGHIQEVIVQNVVPNDRSRFERPSIDTMRRVTAMARWILSPDISVQVPPNLSPTADLLDCGVDDLGGVSPVTPDHINPAYAWPELERLQNLADGAGVPLVERLPVHNRYCPEHEDADSQWLSPRIREAIFADTEAGTRYRHVLASARS